MKLTQSQKSVLDYTFIGSVSILSINTVSRGIVVIQVADIDGIYSATYTIGRRGKVTCAHKVERNY